MEMIQNVNNVDSDHKEIKLRNYVSVIVSLMKIPILIFNAHIANQDFN